jgi:hypothetical protein
VADHNGTGLDRFGLADEASIERAMLLATPVVTAGWVCLLIYGLGEVARQFL